MQNSKILRNDETIYSEKQLILYFLLRNLKILLEETSLKKLKKTLNDTLLLTWLFLSLFLYYIFGFHTTLWFWPPVSISFCYYLTASETTGTNYPFNTSLLTLTFEWPQVSPHLNDHSDHQEFQECNTYIFMSCFTYIFIISLFWSTFKGSVHSVGVSNYN